MRWNDEIHGRVDSGTYTEAADIAARLLAPLDAIELTVEWSYGTREAIRPWVRKHVRKTLDVPVDVAAVKREILSNWRGTGQEGLADALEGKQQGH